jgi:pimeloyl-ACP methyl ester carboxylesterase
MYALLPLLCSAFLAEAPTVQTRLEQVGPVPPNAQFMRSKDQSRAVILIHGFIYHLREKSVSTAAFREWQRPGCILVKALQKDSDVFSFGYAQNASLDDIVKQGKLLEGIAALKILGYREIVLLGHSAGGLIARQTIEDNPDCGVTKVVQVCTPNGGTPTAETKVHACQQSFVDCLSPAGREKCLKARADRKLPEKVEFVCVMGYLEDMPDTDSVVPCKAQWTADLWKQGVPVERIQASHHSATRDAKSAEVLARLTREKQPRWDAARIDKTVKDLFKK